MSRTEWSGAGYLLFMLCASVVAVGYLLLTVMISYVYIIVFFLEILSQGVGHG